MSENKNGREKEMESEEKRMIKAGLKYLQIDRKLHQNCSVKAHKDTIQ